MANGSGMVCIEWARKKINIMWVVAFTRSVVVVVVVVDCADGGGDGQEKHGPTIQPTLPFFFGGPKNGGYVFNDEALHSNVCVCTGMR